MSNKDLNRSPKFASDNVWWYEETSGIEIHIDHKYEDGIKFSHQVITIPWRSIRAALKRKDK